MKSFEIRIFSGPFFPEFALNTEIFSVNLPIQSEYRKTRARKNSLFGHFSCSEFHEQIKIIMGVALKTVQNQGSHNWFLNINA